MSLFQIGARLCFKCVFKFYLSISYAWKFYHLTCIVVWLKGRRLASHTVHYVKTMSYLESMCLTNTYYWAHGFWKWESVFELLMHRFLPVRFERNLKGNALTLCADNVEREMWIGVTTGTEACFQFLAPPGKTTGAVTESLLYKHLCNKSHIPNEAL